MKSSGENQFSVAVIIGSKSDEEIMQSCLRYLDHFGISSEVRVLSAHRNPEGLRQYVSGLENHGTQLIIAAAGMAAHLPGVVASQTTLPVIGVPLSASELNGLDALLSMVQMPTGIPVATVAIGKAGACNAAVLAAEILAVNSPEIQNKLSAFRAKGSKL
jgi:phosphoribosylaminoimidazole carboxylase PurE protein